MSKGYNPGGESNEIAVKRVAGNQYGEDLAFEKRSANERSFMQPGGDYKRASSPEPTCGGAVQGPLEAIGGGSAEKPSFNLY